MAEKQPRNRTKTRTLAAEGEELLDDVVDVTEEPDSIEHELDGVLAHVDEDEQVEVRVHRLTPPGQANKFIDAFLPSDFSLEALRNKWGGGEYKITLMALGSEGPPKIITYRKIAIESLPDAPETPQNQVAGLDSILTFMKASLEKQADKSDRLMELMLTAFAGNRAPAAPAVDPMAIQQSTLAMMVSMKEFMGGNKSEGNNLDALMRGIELANELGGSKGEAGSTDVLMAAIKEFGAPLMQLAQQEKEAQTVKNLGKPRLGSDKQTQKQSAVSTQPAGDDPMLMWKMQLKFLTAQAAANRDPVLYANMVYDQVGLDQVRQFFVNVPDPLGELIKIQADVANHREWFSDLIVELREIVAEVTEPEPAPTKPLDAEREFDRLESELDESLTSTKQSANTPGTVEGEVIDADTDATGEGASGEDS